MFTGRFLSESFLTVVMGRFRGKITLKYKACLRLKWLLLWKELSRNSSAGGGFETT